MGRYLLAWVPMVFIAVGNGAFREGWLAAGRLWVLVPLWVAVAPYVFYRLQE